MIDHEKGVKEKDNYSNCKITGTSTTITGLKAGKYYIKVVPCYKSGGNVQNGASTSAVKCVIK